MTGYFNFIHNKVRQKHCLMGKCTQKLDSHVWHAIISPSLLLGLLLLALGILRPNLNYEFPPKPLGHSSGMFTAIIRVTANLYSTCIEKPHRLDNVPRLVGEYINKCISCVKSDEINTLHSNNFAVKERKWSPSSVSC